MFDISWSELLILGIVTLVFVGPKELPVFMRTLGRYAGVARRHANEFKAQFDAAMREAELDSMRKEVEQMQNSINSEVMKAKSSIDEASSATKIETNVSAPQPSQAISPQPPLPSPEVAPTPPMATAPLPAPPLPASPEKYSSPAERTES
ncbi:Sec-independent protein translocase protein TatB [Hyphomicrobium facile]|uniref:Sec-independent protein translocase protein TatB n=1 Tax=Hyphomicrobium facile TaxID=51670 RepID=A0A1I7NEH2_9HYPH|nr:Sec-independent protein translocase protein TatB [Hyphomicrobium facile]SFV33051.1 sec-independent protein translocase protein TatB [Hyphomicrobium facile]